MQWQGRRNSAGLGEVVKEVLSQKGTSEGSPEGSGGGTTCTTQRGVLGCWQKKKQHRCDGACCGWGMVRKSLVGKELKVMAVVRYIWLCKPLEGLHLLFQA